MLEKSAIIEIIIQLLSWLVFVICGFIKDFYEMLISYFKFIMPKTWGMLHLCTLILQKIFIKCYKN